MSRNILVSLTVICCATLVVHFGTGAGKLTAALLAVEGLMAIYAAGKTIAQKGKKK